MFFGIKKVKLNDKRSNSIIQILKIFDPFWIYLLRRPKQKGFSNKIQYSCPNEH